MHKFPCYIGPYLKDAEVIQIKDLRAFKRGTTIYIYDIINDSTKNMVYEDRLKKVREYCNSFDRKHITDLPVFKVDNLFEFMSIEKDIYEDLEKGYIYIHSFSETSNFSFIEFKSINMD